MTKIELLDEVKELMESPAGERFLRRAGLEDATQFVQSALQSYSRRLKKEVEERQARYNSRAFLREQIVEYMKNHEGDITGRGFFNKVYGGYGMNGCPHVSTFMAAIRDLEEEGKIKIKRPEITENHYFLCD